MTDQLFPLKVRILNSSPFGNSADLKSVAIAEDGQDYAVKTGTVGASELLCYKVFQACSIAVPQHNVLILQDGSTAFGSRIIPFTDTFATAVPTEKELWFRECGPIISSILALDLLLDNVDRHPGNFIFNLGLSDRRTCMAIDFSRALLYGQWPLQNTWSINCNTTLVIQFMKQSGIFDTTAAGNSLLAAGSIRDTTWQKWIDELPAGWITHSQSETLHSWWGSADFQQRIRNCMMAIS